MRERIEELEAEILRLKEELAIGNLLHANKCDQHMEAVAEIERLKADVARRSNRALKRLKRDFDGVEKLKKLLELALRQLNNEALPQLEINLNSMLEITTGFMPEESEE